MTNKAYRIANEILNLLDITIEDLVQRLELIAFKRGAVVRYAHLDSSEARIVMSGKFAVITISTTVDNEARKRFSIAHELGHFELHRNAVTICTSDDISEVTVQEQVSGDYEQEANVFAAALLLPERFFRPLVDQEDPSLEYISSIANQFETSLTSTCLRYCHFSDEPLAVVWSQNGRREWAFSNTEFRELGLFVETRCKLDTRSCAWNLYNGSSTVKRKRVKPSTWLVDGRYDSNASLQEFSIHMSNYDGVLTILWIDEELYEKDF